MRTFVKMAAVVAVVLAASLGACASGWAAFGMRPFVSAKDPAAGLSVVVDRAIVGRREGPLALTPTEIREVLRKPDGSPRPVVVIAPHMDDESLFLGETIAAFEERGVPVTVVFTTSSEGGRRMDPRFKRDRHAVYRQVARILGVRRSIIATIPDGARLGGPKAKEALTRRYVLGTGAVTPDCVLFTIGGAGQYDHLVAEAVGRRIAHDEQLPLFVYWGYGRFFKWRPAMDKEWGPDMRPADLVGDDAAKPLAKKREAIRAYHRMYIRKGWVHYWVSISWFELRHPDEVGFVGRP